MRTLTDPAFVQLLRDALAEGHHSAAAAGRITAISAAEHVIDVADGHAMAAFEHDDIDVDLTHKLDVLHGLAAILYASEQDLQARLDALEERLCNLRTTLYYIANGKTLTVDELTRLALEGIENDDDAAPGAEPITAKEPG
jgi:hypothetical protein